MSFDESSIGPLVIEERHYITGEPFLSVVHVLGPCDGCEGHGQVAGYVRRDSAVDCVDCGGTGQKRDTDCGCPGCCVVIRQVLAKHPSQPWAESTREWVAEREAEHAKAARVVIQ